MKNGVLAACRRMLGPIVRILLRNGVSWREFAELTKEAYVDVARQDYGVQGRPTNVARVAMMTGLSRREVSRLRDAIEGHSAPPLLSTNRISAVLSAWHVDPEFIESDGSPSVLTESGDERSLEALLTRYAGDLPHGAFIKELLQLGLIEKTPSGYRALKRDYLRQPSDPDLLNQAAVAFSDHGETLAFNVDAEREGSARFERMATTDFLSPADLNEFHTFVAQKGQETLEEVDAWLSAHASTDKESGKSGVRAGVGMYLIQGKSNGNKSNQRKEQ